MTNKKNNLLLGLLATVLLVAGCNGNDDSSKKPSSSNQPAPSVSTNDGASNSTKPSSGPVQEDTYTYHDYTTVSPSNWNELTYQDNNDTQIMSYIGSSFFGYDFKFDEDGEIVSGDFAVEYSAATSLVDVTKDYAGVPGWGIPEGTEKHRAYKITLRDDLKWDDGTPIHAEDFVYTMKEQLNPDFLNYRADSFYKGATVIHNAEAYVKQGQDTTVYVGSALRNLDIDLDTYLAEYGTGKSYINWNYSFGKMLDKETGKWVKAENKVVDSKFTVAELWDIFKAAIEDEDTAYEYFTTEVTVEFSFQEMTFDKVGIFVGDTIDEIVLVLDIPLALLKEDGSLDYKAAYNMSSLPLVKRDLYEECKDEPQGEATLWTSHYNSSLESTASWGPYKLVEFQNGKHYTLERNEYWYGYNMDEYAGQYQTDRIEVETIAEWNTAWLKFLSGDITSIGIDVSVAAEYKNSSRAIFTPDDYVGSMQIQSNIEQLKAREEEGVNKTILAYPDFRKAISLAVDRDAYNNKCTTSSLAGFGLFNSMHYHDVANGAAYRETDYAKRVLCEVYGVNLDDYDSLDDAVDSITGYDLAQAKALVESAYQAALEAGDIKATDKVVITFGSGADNEAVRRQYNFLSKALIEMVKGTSLDGRLETEFEDHQEEWGNDFKAGLYDICTGGWEGAAWDPGYFLLAYLDPNYMFSQAWDTSAHNLTFTMPELEDADYAGEGEELTMNLMYWYYCLNGYTDAPFNWAEGAIPVEARLALIARLEQEILTQYYTVPISNYYGASLVSYQIEYITTEYNTFMGYGGIRYMTYNFTDAEWAEYVVNNEIDYKL